MVKRGKVLVVGQMMPVNSGQVVMIRRLCSISFEGIELHAIPMNLADDVSEMGRFSLRKLFRVGVVIARVLRYAIVARPDVLYYCPGGDRRLPILRDAAVLCATRWLFPRTVFHFHATGAGHAYQAAPWGLRHILGVAYRRPDMSIRITEFNPPDGEMLESVREVVVYNGIPDAYQRNLRPRKAGPIEVLFVGKVSREKGAIELIEAFSKLRQRGCDVALSIVGSFQSEELATTVQTLARNLGVDRHVRFFGSLEGDALLERYYSADVFCLPSYFETFGLTAVEAMQFELPVVATAVGGLRAIVDDGVTGTLVPARNATALADALERLTRDPERARAMGEAGREKYLSQFTAARFAERMKAAFDEVLSSG